jgi:hypothetical protein
MRELQGERTEEDKEQVNGSSIGFREKVQSEVKVFQADIYQVTTYALRYQCKQVFLIYPLFKGNEDFNTLLAKFKIPHETGDITISVMQIELNMRNEGIQHALKEHIGLSNLLITYKTRNLYYIDVTKGF